MLHAIDFKLFDSGRKTLVLLKMPLLYRNNETLASIGSSCSQDVGVLLPIGTRGMACLLLEDAAHVLGSGEAAEASDFRQGKFGVLA